MRTASSATHPRGFGACCMCWCSASTRPPWLRQTPQHCSTPRASASTRRSKPGCRHSSSTYKSSSNCRNSSYKNSSSSSSRSCYRLAGRWRGRHKTGCTPQAAAGVAAAQGLSRHSRALACKLGPRKVLKVVLAAAGKARPSRGLCGCTACSHHLEMSRHSSSSSSSRSSSLSCCTHLIKSSPAAFGSSKAFCIHTLAPR
mmetsp:Transcript_5317/g.12494  ORF Transcript_5317/g.12494 Transcript_5317/m.12494 type:complete len:200 (-) Transcript_5317:512-1111(-)